MIYKFKNHKIELYDTIHSLPILRFRTFNKLSIMALEIGSDFKDYDDRTTKSLAFLSKGMVQEAHQEILNRRQTVWNAMEEQSPSMASFAVMVYKIDDVVYNEYAPDNLENILIHLNDIGLDIETMKTQLVELKKKINLELSVYFPKYFPKNSNANEKALWIKAIDIRCDQIIQGKEFAEQLFDVEKQILEADKPNNWNVHVEGNMERSLELDFQKFAISVTKLSGGDLENMVVMRFYATVEQLEDEHRSNKK